MAGSATTAAAVLAVALAAALAAPADALCVNAHTLQFCGALLNGQTVETTLAGSLDEIDRAAKAQAVLWTGGDCNDDNCTDADIRNLAALTTRLGTADAAQACYRAARNFACLTVGASPPNIISNNCTVPQPTHEQCNAAFDACGVDSIDISTDPTVGMQTTVCATVGTISVCGHDSDVCTPLTSTELGFAIGVWVIIPVAGAFAVAIRVCMEENQLGPWKDDSAPGPGGISVGARAGGGASALPGPGRRTSSDSAVEMTAAKPREAKASSTSSGAATGPWKCSHCTFDNPAGSDTCSMCTSARE